MFKVYQFRYLLIILYQYLQFGGCIYLLKNIQINNIKWKDFIYFLEVFDKYKSNILIPKIIDLSLINKSLIISIILININYILLKVIY